MATFDLWQDIGDFALTGIAPTCDGGEEAFFDSMILGPTIASLDAYRPRAAANDATDSVSFGNALTDNRNPIHKLFRGERLDLWSLRGPGKSGLETSPRSSQNGSREPSCSIDDFIRERLAKENLQLLPEADRRTLIRRLTFGLIGLPPTPDEVAAFVADDAPDAYDQLVTRLLDSPRYGERQARLWLDVVRYADTNGYERDEFRPLAWQYRDYVIRSFNEDKPFDQFIVEQLAGDELVAGVPKNSAEADMLIATGFLRLGQWDSTASIFEEEPRLHAEMMVDLTNTTSSAFLGLTMSCCQCHDHKYDPLSQADHFRFRAYFAGVTSRDDLPISLTDEQAEIDAHNAELDQQAVPLTAEQEKLDAANKERHEVIQKKLAAIEAQKRQPRFAMGATESASPAVTHIFYQCDFASPREEVQPGIPTVLGSESRDSLREPTRQIAERTNTIDSRRLKLASWIASADNPWTARVIVNRLWQQHFGTGIVATPNDFGYSGARPSHPELLDWLAVEFIRRGWSIKELHRLIVTSATYRQKSGTVFQPVDSAMDKTRTIDRQDTYRMQLAAIDIGELSLETKETQDSYGLHDEKNDKALFGRMCLLSRRLVEKGVRFVQLYNAVDKLGWDAHDNNTDYHNRNAAQTDQPIAALLSDLKQRGLLDTTLVIWAGEFGRTPMMQGNNGRNHNPYGFTIWMAGGGVKAGRVIGSTDDIGLRAADQPQSVKNLHATILTALGINPDDLFFDHAGRQERLTGVAQSWKTIPGVLG